MGIPVEMQDGRSLDVTRYQHRRVKWTQIVWYGRQADLLSTERGCELGSRFEAIAKRDVLPSLRVTDVVQLSTIAHHAPFDFLGTFRGERIAVDVSTKWQKRVDGKAPMAAAFGLPLYILLISPRDPQHYFFGDVSPMAKTIRVPMQILKIMAEDMAEVSVRDFPWRVPA